MSVLYSEENALLRAKIFAASVPAVVPFLAAIIRQGIAEGAYDVEYPEECAELLLNIGQALATAVADLLLNAPTTASALAPALLLLERRVKAYERSVERMWRGARHAPHHRPGSTSCMVCLTASCRSVFDYVLQRRGRAAWAGTIKLAWRNMWRNWRRTAIVLVAIVLGLILLLLFDSLIKGSDQAIYGNAVRIYGGAIQVHVPGYREKAHRLPLLSLADPAAVVQAALLSPESSPLPERIQTGGLIVKGSESQPVGITAIQPSVESAMSIHAANVVAGRYLLDGEGDAIFIGQALADLLDAQVGDRVTLLGHGRHETMRQRTMTVVGIFALGSPDLEKGAVFITLNEAQSLFDLNSQATEVAISLSDISHETTVLPALQAALPGYEVDSWQTLRPEITETMATKALFVSIMGILIASIGILNLQLMAVFERTR